MLVQVVPLGLDWPSENYYGGPTSEMGLRYLEYKIKPEDNSRIIIVYGHVYILLGKISKCLIL